MATISNKPACGTLYRSYVVLQHPLKPKKISIYKQPKEAVMY